MPLCKNDPHRSYKGTEPCPKGFGYCPHKMKVGTVMRRRDGRLWIIKKLKKNKGYKDWIQLGIYRKNLSNYTKNGNDTRKSESDRQRTKKSQL